MAINFDALNVAVAGAFADKAATWVSQAGSVAIQVALTIAPAYDGDGYRIAGESITADCLAQPIAAMKRGEVLIIDTVHYAILAVHFDGTGWANLILEKQ